ncbi:hypothetical protein ACTHSJ_33725 [Paenibacillus cellulositrophicus]|uniref:hypothetical protein n=1 Tax=Paenibacillus cellulositrophicus TaxID=562959 RepID=UPI003F7FDD35
MNDKDLTKLSNILAKEMTNVMGINVSGSYLKEAKQILINGNDTNKVKRLSLKLNFFLPESKSDSQTGYPLDRFIIRITDIEVVPERQHYGTRIIKSLLRIAPEVIKIDRVILFASGEEVKGFWERMNFRNHPTRPLSMHTDIQNNLSIKIKRFANKVFNKGKP